LAGLKLIRALVNAPESTDQANGLLLVGDGAQRICLGTGATLSGMNRDRRVKRNTLAPRLAPRNPSDPEYRSAPVL
jgi:hypothetical protein